MKNRKILYFLILFVWLFGANENIFAQRRKAPPKNNVVVKSSEIISVIPPRNLSPEQQRRLDTFNFVWQTIKSNYFDQTFSGLDWDKLKKEFEPRVMKTASDGQLHDILQEMINRLDRSHFAVIPPEVYQAIERAKAEAKAKDEKQTPASENENSEEEIIKEDLISEDYSARFGVGIDLRLIDNRFVITRIEKNSAAETAGLKTGYAIDKVNDVSLAELLKQIENYYANIRNVKRHLSAQIIDSMLNGEKDSFVILTVSGETEPPKEIKVQREKLKGETISLGKNYPEQFLRFETASLNAEVGFVKFNLFALPVVEKFCSALTQLKDKKAIIIDLRGNGGGILGSLVGLGGMLTEKSIDLGTSIYKIGSENMVALSKVKNYKGRLVFLVDKQTVSAAEIFSAALQENNRALIVGEKTAGEALPSVSVELPTGAVLLYPIANFKTRNGNFLEGKGVEPNYIVALDRKTLLAGEDKQLETALRVIKENKAFPKSQEGMVTIITGDRNSPSPPPPPAPKLTSAPVGKKLAEVTIKAINPPLPPKTIDKKDEKALHVIADFINKIGGAEAYNKINSYTLKGKSAINIRGSKTDLEINIFLQKPGKYAEIMKSDVLGEVRQIYNGKKSFVQADYGLNTDLMTGVDTARIEIFSPINNLIRNDAFKSITYQGIFDRQGRKAHIIEAETVEYINVAMAFDVETKLLVSYIQQFYAVSYGDYRQIENLLLPFVVEREGFMNIELEEIKLNTAIEESNFLKKENCFDRAN